VSQDFTENKIAATFYKLLEGNKLYFSRWSGLTDLIAHGPANHRRLAAWATSNMDKKSLIIPRMLRKTCSIVYLLYVTYVHKLKNPRAYGWLVQSDMRIGSRHEKENAGSDLGMNLSSRTRV
jgi:hypothetical protein